MPESDIWEAWGLYVGALGDRFEELGCPGTPLGTRGGAGVDFCRFWVVLRAWEALVKHVGDFFVINDSTGYRIGLFVSWGWKSCQNLMCGHAESMVNSSIL